MVAHERGKTMKFSQIVTSKVIAIAYTRVVVYKRVLLQSLYGKQNGKFKRWSLTRDDRLRGWSFKESYLRLPNQSEANKLRPRDRANVELTMSHQIVYCNYLAAYFPNDCQNLFNKQNSNKDRYAKKINIWLK